MNETSQLGIVFTRTWLRYVRVFVLSQFRLSVVCLVVHMNIVIAVNSTWWTFTNSHGSTNSAYYYMYVYANDNKSVSEAHANVHCTVFSFRASDTVRYWRHHVFGLSNCPSVCASRMFMNMRFRKSLGAISQNCNVGALGDKYELIRFWGQKVKGQGRDQNKYGTTLLFTRTTMCYVNYFVTQNVGSQLQSNWLPEFWVFKVSAVLSFETKVCCMFYDLYFL